MSAPKQQPTALGEVILARSRKLALSRLDLADKAGLAENTISNAIYGKRRSQRKTLEGLARALEVPVATLISAAAETPDPQESHASFWVWLLRADNTKLWVSLVGIAMALVVILFSGEEGGVSKIPWGIHVIQCAVIFLLLGMLPKSRSLAHSGASKSLVLATDALQDFETHWSRAWGCWLSLYAVLAVATRLFGFPHAGAPTLFDHGVQLVLDVLQNGCTVWLLLCYEVVALPTIEDDRSRRRNVPNRIWVGAIAVLAIVEIAVVLHEPSWWIQEWLGWLSGFAQGTALALLIGRFDSKYVDPPAIAVGLLYFYAVIQGAWQAFQGHPELMILLTFTALALKCLLFLFVSWLFETDIILFYLAGMRRLDRHVRHDRASFLARYRAGDLEDLGDLESDREP